MEFYLLLAIAVLQVVDGQGLALRIGRLLSLLIGGPPNVEKADERKTSTGEKTR